MTRWMSSITTAVAITITSCAIASAQTADPNRDPNRDPNSDPNQVPVQTPAPSKSRLDRFGDRFDITAIPAGALWVRDGKTRSQPGFQSYVPGAALGVKLSRFVEVEGEAAFGVGQRQALKFDGAELGDFKTPTLFGYTGSVLVNAVSSDRKVVPYGVAGLGGVFVSSREELGINDSSNFFVGEVGGGAKVMFGKWGVRGDYRFLSLRGQDDDESFVGTKTRFAHRIYGGLVIAPGRDSSGS